MQQVTTLTDKNETQEKLTHNQYSGIAKELEREVSDNKRLLKQLEFKEEGMGNLQKAIDQLKDKCFYLETELNSKS